MTNFIFTNRFGNPHNPQAVNRAIKRIVDAHNAEEEVAAKKEKREPVMIPRFSCHIFRHTWDMQMSVQPWTSMLKPILRLRKRLLRSWQKIWMYFETKYDMIRKESSIKGDWEFDQKNWKWLTFDQKPTEIWLFWRFLAKKSQKGNEGMRMNANEFRACAETFPTMKTLGGKDQ